MLKILGCSSHRYLRLIRILLLGLTIFGIRGAFTGWVDSTMSISAGCDLVTSANYREWWSNEDYIQTNAVAYGSQSYMYPNRIQSIYIMQDFDTSMPKQMSRLIRILGLVTHMHKLGLACVFVGFGRTALCI